MSWGKLLQPDLWLNDTLFSLTPELLQQYELRGLVLDVDETIVPRTIQQLSDEVVPWVKAAKQVAPQIWLVSNNPSVSRIERIATLLEVPYIARAGKPSRHHLRRAVEAMNLPPPQVGMVGDRLFTDVLAGNRLGMCTVLVKPMPSPETVGRKYFVHALEFKVSRALGADLVPHKP
ncbi:YqeG family HAD IIIA-type phosphatase [filamentous cyanobacterium LEGE 11480]|uniref:YqeG family HAD IIIA-type phosphatase n=1 Tax=Romeriopsis navalis LEGE 11480 TaxID=2777977 RepID=A0A928Z6J3_9CYAN|nr:YqeG family HAD IIIA-type phosphatase [Romeriopsis navalis]MBE9032285.1 YqeG family HAD IIIA-type phosphatase [Romeriopsis navalis LEGE 11480]